MDEPAHDELAPDAQPVASSDFFDALGENRRSPRPHHLANAERTA